MSNDRIFVLGAGASKHATSHLEIGMPLAREFFKSKYINEYWPDNHLKEYCFANSELAKFVSQYFSISFKRKFLPKKFNVEIDSSVNIEEVFSFLEFIENGFYDKDGGQLIKNSKNQLLKYLFSILNGIMVNEYNEKLYNKMINSLELGDSIITYNWDLLLDNALLNSRKGKVLLKNLQTIINPFDTFNTPDYEKIGFDDFHKGYFIKQHGSINWACCSNKTCIRNSIPFVFDVRSDIWFDMWHCNYCGSFLELMLLPPHVHKTYKQNRFFSLQAKIALDKIRTARELVIIGYSFPLFDFETNSLFRYSRLSYEDSVSQNGTFLEKVVIVNPEVKSKDYLNKINELFGLKNSKKHYGNKVELQIYDSINDFILKHKLEKRKVK